MATTAIMLGVGVGLMALSFLLRPKPKSSGQGLQQDDAPTTIANRGAFLPLIIGRRRTGYVFGWAGNREIRKESTGGGGGKGRSTPPSQQSIYYESGWHQLCVGNGIGLYRITQAGQTIFETEITPSTHPSGSTLTADNNEGTFRVYWGEVDQPIDSDLASGLGVSSRWPYVMYIFWHKKRLGTGANWPDIKYEYKVQCPNVQITGIDPELGTTGQEGANPANALFQLLTGEYPFGVGLVADEVDLTSLLTVDTTMDSEDLGMNLLFDNGMTGDTAVGKILSEAGVMMFQNGERLAFKEIREPSGTLPILSEDVLMAPDVEYEIGDNDAVADRVIFVYKDRGFNYRDVDIKYDNDGISGQRRRYNSSTINLETATTSNTANAIARRRVQEELGNKQRLRVQATRGFRSIMVGDAVTLENFGTVRITGKSYNSKDAHATLDLVPDSYGIPDTGDDQGSVTSDSPVQAVAADLSFTFMELPAELSSQVSIVVFRLRAHSQIDSAGVYVSGDATSFTYVADENSFSQGGQLEGSMVAATSDIVETGPIFEDANGDAEYILDLSGDTASWQDGRQVCVINDEVFFLRNVTVQTESPWMATTAYIVGDFVIPSTANGMRYECTSGGTSAGTEPTWPMTKGDTVNDGTVTWTAKYPAYTLKGLIRAQYGTSKEAHSSADYVYINDANSMTALTDANIAAGVNVCVKTEPRVGGSVYDLSLVTAVCKNIVGLAVGSPSFLTDESGDNITTNTGQGIQIKETS